MVVDIAARAILKELWELKPHCSRPLNEYKIRKQGDEETRTKGAEKEQPIC